MILSFILFTAAVAIITYFLTRRTIHDTSEGFFLAGRSLGPVVIAGSILLTNLSTEQLVGLNGAAFADGILVTAWETLAGVSMAVLALVFLPRYLKSGLTTTPQFLEERFSPGTRLLGEGLFLTGYVVILLPIVLASGALFMSEVFGVRVLVGDSKEAAVWTTVWAIGIIGSAYAILGGLRGVAVSDTLNGIGLVIGGLLIPFFGLKAISDGGGVAEGWKILTEARPEKFDIIGGPEASVPFGTLFTGVILLHLFYWCTNQVIVQRTLAAKSLADGQKGVLLAAFIKLLAPLIIVIPGIIAFHLYGDQIESKDEAYPVLVRNVLPTYLSGFFAAVVFGAILSSFNSALNSAATLFSTGIYKKVIRPAATEHQMVKTGRLFSLGLALAAMVIAPFIALYGEGIFGYLQKANGCYAIPMLAVMIVALFTKRMPAASAIFGILFGSVAYLVFAFVIPIPSNEFHLQGIIFVLTMAGMFVIGHFRPRAEPFVQKYSGDVDITPWKFAYPVAALTVGGALATYIYFS
ncbi:solute:sodium symporter family transporter [soil metagenome]